MSRCLYVGNIPCVVGEDEILALFGHRHSVRRFRFVAFPATQTYGRTIRYILRVRAQAGQ
jgi:RNA recognition motif-containing protein